jgi:thiol-disulfide isomerase/thioredoxin
MKKGIFLVSAVLVGIFVMMVVRARQDGRTSTGDGLEIGQPAPAFQLQDLDGNAVSLEDFKGKVVMLDFWAIWCAPCRATMPELEKLELEHPNDFVLLAINLGDPADRVAAYVQRQKIQSRVLLDTETKTGMAYGARSIPRQYVIDKDGMLRHSQVGAYPGWIDDLWAEIEKLK